MNTIENIIFDLGGVVLNIDYHLTTRAFTEKGIPHFEQLYSQLSQSHLFDDYETGKIDTAAFIARLTATAPGLQPEEVVHSWNAMLLDLPADRIAWIQALRPRYKTFVFSNTNDLHETAFNREVKRVTGADDLSAFFDRVYLSHKIGYRKPHPEGFRMILADNNLHPAATLFIDDSPQHIAGARQLGLQTLYLPGGSNLQTELSAILNHL